MNPDKLNAARAAGYSDQEINNYMRSANILSGSSNNTSQQQQPKKKKGGFLTNLLPTIGGAIGAVGGSFLAPIAGTAAGGAAGSAFGEFLRQKITGDTEGGLGNIVREGAFGALPGVGKLAKGGVTAVKAVKAGRAANKAQQGAASILGNTAIGGTEASQAVRSGRLGSNVLALDNNQSARSSLQQSVDNEQFNRLARENISKLGSESANRGLPLPGGGVLQRPGPQPSFASEGVELRPNVQVPSQMSLTPSPKTTATEILNPSPLTERAVAEERPINGLARTADRLFGRSTGIQPGAKVGSQQLTAKRATELKDHIRTNIGSKPTDAADTILRRNESFIQNKSQDLNRILDQKNAPIKEGEGSRVLSKMKQPTGIDLPSNGTYQALVTEAQGIKDLKGLEGFRRNVDEIINFSRSAASPDPATERVALAARRAIDDYMTKKIPDLKPIKKELSKAYDTQTFIQPAANKPGGFGAFGVKVGGRAAQGVAGAASKGADILGGGLQGGAGSLSRQLVGAGFKQAGTRAVGSALLGTPAFGSGQSEQPQDQSGVDMQGILSQMGAGGDMASGIGGEQPATTEEDAAIQALQILAMQAASNGDTNQANAFTAQAKYLSDQQTKGGLNVTKTTAQQYGLAQSGSQALQNLSAMIEQDPNVVNRTATPGRQLPVVGGFISNAAGTGQYDAIGYNIADSILRLRTGAQANESEVKKLQSQIMPRAGDSPDTIRTKMQQIDQIFSSVLDRAQAGGGAAQPSDTKDALAQLGY